MSLKIDTEANQGVGLDKLEQLHSIGVKRVSSRRMITGRDPPREDSGWLRSTRGRPSRSPILGHAQVRTQDSGLLARKSGQY